LLSVRYTKYPNTPINPIPDRRLRNLKKGAAEDEAEESSEESDLEWSLRSLDALEWALRSAESRRMRISDGISLIVNV
jgi:hypothetical protein